jgi:hypothetical protein
LRAEKIFNVSSHDPQTDQFDQGKNFIKLVFQTRVMLRLKRDLFFLSRRWEKWKTFQGIGLSFQPRPIPNPAWGSRVGWEKKDPAAGDKTPPGSRVTSDGKGGKQATQQNRGMLEVSSGFPWPA